MTCNKWLRGSYCAASGAVSFRHKCDERYVHNNIQEEYEVSN